MSILMPTHMSPAHVHTHVYAHVCTHVPNTQADEVLRQFETAKIKGAPTTKPELARHVSRSIDKVVLARSSVGTE